MATKKKAKRAQKTAERNKKKKKSSGLHDPFFPDFSKINFEEGLSKFIEELSEEPLWQAQEIINDARENDDPKERVSMAFKALAVSPDCADAYVTLAEDNSNLWEERLSYYTLGVAAGRRTIDDYYFEEEVGNFWGLGETRPYMRARLGLAICLDEAEATDQAINHFSDMLRLNPDDNQGVRHFLMAALLKNGDDGGVTEILMSYSKDHSVEFTYVNALMSFKKFGISEKPKKHLKEAIHFNQHVPGFLLGAKSIPEALPPYTTVGEEDEAAHFVEMFGNVWRDTPGALEWLKNETKG